MSVKEILSELTDRFNRAGIEEAKADARILTAFALNKTPVFLRMNPDFEITPDQWRTLQGYAERRIKREPVSKIIQTRGFWRLDFKVTKDVLDPRADSETLIEEALKIFKDRTVALNILDLGTGTGCLAQALLCEFVHAHAVGLDNSSQALAIAVENAATNGLKDRFKVVCADWNQEGWERNLERFDLIISNPPYIPETQKSALEPEVVLFDPPQALFAGSDGLDAYRKIAPSLSGLMKEQAVFITEFGKDQHQSVRQIICSAGLKFNAFGTDLAGTIRCLSAFR